MVESLEFRVESDQRDQRDQRDAGPNCGGTAREDSRPTKGTAWFRGNSVILSKVKITKRTQFKNRTTCHPRQPRRITRVSL